VPIDQTHRAPNHNGIKKGAGIPPTGRPGITPEEDVALKIIQNTPLFLSLHPQLSNITLALAADR
jgi:hypothetical protein